MTKTNIVTIQMFYTALNAADFSGALQLLHPQIERVEFEADKFKGLVELDSHMRQGRGTWAEGACTPERFEVSGDKVVVKVHVRVRLKDKSDWIDGYVSDGFAFSEGKIIEFHSFSDAQKAMNWAKA